MYNYQYSSWDYMVAGSIGFAQLGQNDYFDKRTIEKEIIVEYFRNIFPVPNPLDKLQVAYYKWKGFDHDFGRYYELCVMYNRDIIDTWEESNDPEEVELHNLFYNWFNKVESFDFDILEDACIYMYDESKLKELEVEVAFKEMLFHVT